MNALGFEASKVALKQDATGYVLTLRIHPDQIPEELLRDFVGARYMVGMARVNDDENAQVYENRVKKAGMLCKNSSFWEWQQLEGLDTLDAKELEKRSVDALCELCGINSRTELNGNKQAQEAFDNMVKEYEEWKFKDLPF
jgi:hypothetical protein